VGFGRVVRPLYRVVWLPFIYWGAQGKIEFIWELSDTLNMLMAIPNLIALFALAGVVVALARGFVAGEAYAPPEASGAR
jgi:AGCS family alanine or glycine:cation symporter